MPRRAPSGSGPGDTIAAVSSSRGEGAIGVVRVSGPGAVAVLRRVVPGLPNPLAPRKVHIRWAIDPVTNAPIDRVLCFCFRAPRSYTGEDLAEIQGHGGVVSLDRILSAVLAAGGRPAEPGEFTKRAYLNGRLSLLAAEATAALISARSERAARLMAQHLGREAERLIDGLARGIVSLSAEVEARLDFPEDDLPEPEVAAWAASLEDLAGRLEALARSCRAGERLTSGVRVVLAGLPNAGKSTLFNALLGRARALVDESPGTTRDYLEAESERGGLRITWIDTAGLRASDDRIEAAGAARTLAEAARADLVVWVVDGVRDRASDLKGLADRAANPGVVVAVNKQDLPGWRDDNAASAWPRPRRFPVSAATGRGVEALADGVAAMLAPAEGAGDVLLFTARQARAAAEAAGALRAALACIERRAPLELLAQDLFDAREALARLTGARVEDAVLDEIFSKFCIGK